MISICIPTYKRPENILMLLSNLLTRNKEYDEILVAFTGTIEQNINPEQKKIFSQLLEAYDMKNINLKIKDDFEGLMEAKIWFKNEAENEILLIIDDDAIVDENYIKLKDKFNDPELGAISGVLQTPINYYNYIDWNNKAIDIDPSIKKANTLLIDEDGQQIVKDKYQVYMHEDTDRIFECEYLIGTALMIRKTLFEPDINYQQGNASGEEIDFTYNIYRQGYKLWFYTGAIAWHLDGQKGGMRGLADKTKENNKYLKEKYNL